MRNRLKDLKVGSKKWNHSEGVPKKLCIKCNTYKIQSEYYSPTSWICSDCESQYKKNRYKNRAISGKEYLNKASKQNAENKRITETIKNLKNQRINNSETNN